MSGFVPRSSKQSVLRTYAQRSLRSWQTGAAEWQTGTPTAQPIAVWSRQVRIQPRLLHAVVQVQK